MEQLCVCEVAVSEAVALNLTQPPRRNWKLAVEGGPVRSYTTRHHAHVAARRLRAAGRLVLGPICHH